jgi:hypothetical protein
MVEGICFPVGDLAMTEIMLTSDQSLQVAMATDGVVFCDPAGNVIARVPPVCSVEESATVEEAKRRLESDQPRYPYSEVRARLKSRES